MCLFRVEPVLRYSQSLFPEQYTGHNMPHPNWFYSCSETQIQNTSFEKTPEADLTLRQSRQLPGGPTKIPRTATVRAIRIWTVTRSCINRQNTKLCQSPNTYGPDCMCVLKCLDIKNIGLFYYSNSMYPKITLNMPKLQLLVCVPIVS